MIDYENMRKTVAKGLKEYLKVPVIRNNQNSEPPPYPFVGYTVTTLMSENKGTYGEYDDGKARKPVITTMSITAYSKDNIESVDLANKAREWLDYFGTTYLNDNGVIVQSVGSVTNRDNVLTIGYECRNGFDCFFWGFDVVDIPQDEEIETINFDEDINKKLEKRLSGLNYNPITYIGTPYDDADKLNKILEKRLDEGE